MGGATHRRRSSSPPGISGTAREPGPCFVRTGGLVVLNGGASTAAAATLHFQVFSLSPVPAL